MARTVNSTIVTALAADNIKPFYAVNLEFATPVYYWTGIGTLVSGSITYQGAQDLLAIDGLSETGDLTANGATLTLSGVPSALVTIALATPYHGRKCKIYFGVKGNSNLTEVFSGYMDKMTISENESGATITVNVENKLVDLDRVRVRRYTHESQKTRYASDTFFSFMADMSDKTVNWGKPDA
jgi:hypothetical protein